MARATPTWHASPPTRAICSTPPRNRSPASAAIDAHGRANDLTIVATAAGVLEMCQCLRAGATPPPPAGPWGKVRLGGNAVAQRRPLRRGLLAPPRPPPPAKNGKGV